MPDRRGRTENEQLSYPCVARFADPAEPLFAAGGMLSRHQSKPSGKMAPAFELRRLRWTKDPDKIIAAVRRGHQVLESLH